MLLALLAAPLGGQAATFEEVFTSAAIPGGAAGGLSIVFTKDYRGAVPHAAIAFARGEGGRAAWAFVGGRASPEEAARDALARCAAQAVQLPNGSPCRLLATDAGVVDGPVATPVQAQLGPFRYSPLHRKWGPEAGRGVVVWGHGYGGPARDLRLAAAPGFLTGLNEAGWDVVRFDRHPGDDNLAATLPRLVRGLPQLRDAGYRRIVLGGQSRGGWQAMLAAAERPDLVETVIAAAPAAHGEAGGANNHAVALEDFQRALAGFREPTTRLAVILFDGDDYDPDPAARAALVTALDRQRPTPTLALWARPPPRGHAGVADWRFTRDYAACLLTFVQGPSGVTLRGLRREGCGGG